MPQEQKVTIGAYCTTLEDYLRYLQLQKEGKTNDADKEVAGDQGTTGVESPLLEEESEPSTSSSDCYDSEYSSAGSSSLSTQQVSLSLKRL
uniref:PA domain-containing protein n=1 Tax=Steinernema glaseri TaxID=37863 RepID=A0A1I7ZG64_9BILA